MVWCENEHRERKKEEEARIKYNWNLITPAVSKKDYEKAKEMAKQSDSESEEEQPKEPKPEKKPKKNQKKKSAN